MRIAVLASNFISLPPDSRNLPKGFSGAAERIAWEVAEELVKRKHEVTLYASGDSQTSACLQCVTKKATSIHNKPVEYYLDYEHLLVSQAYIDAKKGNFDIIHSHLTSRTAFYAPLVDIPTVVTLHSPLTGQAGRVLLKRPKDQYYVSISNAQRAFMPDLNFVSTVYHGIDVENFPYCSSAEEYLVFAGRIVPQKGVVEAIDTAILTNSKMVILGLVDEDENSYYHQEVLPLLNKYSSIITVKGKTDFQELKKIISQAKALIFPIKWEEPFGLVMIEAMATGTPVVAFARGAVPEVVADGVTGYIVNSEEKDKRGVWIVKKTGIEGLREAVERIYSMHHDQYRQMRQACRKRVLTHFTVEKMVEGYVEVYKKILGN